MVQIELPIVYAKNYSELEKAQESGIEIEVEEVINMSTFIVPDSCLIRMNEATKKERTTIYFDSEAYEIDLTYETVRMLFTDAINKSR